MSQAISIDNYLHTHSEERKIVLMGKLAIAASILEAEAACAIRVEPHGEIKFGALTQTWHATFFRMLTEDVKKDAVEDIFENIVFVSFNYDRCIEHYIAEALRNYFLMPRVDAQKLALKLKVIHPYGQVGKLPWQVRNDGGVPFGLNYSPQILPSISDEIRTFTEQVEDDGRLVEMRSVLTEAEQIVCLGFSYGRMNLELLKVGDNKKPYQGACYGASYGISKQNQAFLSYELRKVFRLTDIAALSDVKFDQFLQDNWLQIMA